jgi:hypothetical protein
MRPPRAPAWCDLNSTSSPTAAPGSSPAGTKTLSARRRGRLLDHPAVPRRSTSKPNAERVGPPPSLRGRLLVEDQPPSAVAPDVGARHDRDERLGPVSVAMTSSRVITLPSASTMTPSGAIVRP